MKKILKKGFYNWQIDNDYLNEIIANENKDPKYYILNRKELTDIVIKDMLNNKSYFNYVISTCKKKFFYNENFKFTYDKEQAPILININNKKIISFLKLHPELLDSSWQKKYTNKLMDYSSLKHFEESFIKYNGTKNISYSQIINLLTKDLEVLNKSNLYKNHGEELYQLVEKLPFNLNNLNDEYSIKHAIDLDEKDLANIYNNYLKLKYDYEKDHYENRIIKTNREFLDSYSLNEKLKKELLEEMPSSFSKTQQAYYIYKRLCQKFTYDSDYFIHSMYDSINSKIDHFDINRIKTLDGKQEIICGEIALIYAKFLDLLDIPCEILNYDEKTVPKLRKMHLKNRFKIDKFLIDADASFGIFKSDLSMEKSTGEVQKFKLKNNASRYLDEFNHDIKEVDDYINEHNINLEYKDATEIYKSIIDKELSESIGIKERIGILEDAIKENKSSFIDMMIWTNNLKKQILKDKDNYCKIEYIANNNPTNKNKNMELAILIMYNENHPIKELDSKNEYDLITENKVVENMEFSSLKYRFDKGIYLLTDPSRELPGLVKGENHERKNFERNRR